MKKLLLCTAVLFLSFHGEGMADNKSSLNAQNVLGTDLQPYGQELNTGFYRDGFWPGDRCTIPLETLRKHASD
ncbi:MAG: hypothetical protein KGI37_09080 [Alphaproteobacteria bacterium]|nr:hypothetical protein [Alphaproteobacteria bacterium]